MPDLRQVQGSVFNGSTVARYFMLVVCTVLGVACLSQAWLIGNAPRSQCRTVLRGPYRSLRYTCLSDAEIAQRHLSPEAGVSPGYATVRLLIFGLGTLAIVVVGAIVLFRRQGTRTATDRPDQELLDDLDELDALHRSGALAHDQMVLAKRERRRQRRRRGS